MTTRNRGKQSSDDRYFADKWAPVLTEACDDLCFLLGKRYNEDSALQLVGNRYKLNQRQRMAVRRVCAGQYEIDQRMRSMCTAQQVVGKSILIDGFNLLILLENAMSGAFIFEGRDKTYRDISGVHGSYKKVQKTTDAINLTGNVLRELKVESVHWFLDKPVSNSGRLKNMLIEISTIHNFNWRVELEYNPDKILAQSNDVIVTTDGWILNQTGKWFNLGRLIIDNYIQGAQILTY